MTQPTLRAIAKAVGKAPSTVMRWKKDNPALYEAARDYAAKHATPPR